MCFSKSKLRHIVLAAMFFVVSLSGAQAATPVQTPPKVAAAPDPSSNQVLAGFINLGAKLFYLGNTGGLDGWLVIKDAQVQFAYSSNDGQHALLGAMFSPDGQNITANQFNVLYASNKEVVALLNAAAPAQAGEVKTEPQNPAGAVKTGLSTTPFVSVPALPAAPSVATLPPGEKLVQDLSAAAGVVVGNPSAPQILMVMDPDCPHCQATWRMLREAVLANKLQIRLIPIANPDTDHEKAAAQLLHAADPLTAWDKYVGPKKGEGDKSLLAGTPDPSLVDAVRTNHGVIDSWKITATPYLVYRAKDGKVKIVKGEPAMGANLLNELIQE